MSLPVTCENDQAQAPTLSPVLSQRWALRWSRFATISFFAALFLVFNYLPVTDARIWLQAFQGREILQHGGLALMDQTQPLAEGMPFVPTGCLSQLALALADAWGGPQSVANLLAVVGLCCCLILARVFFLQTGRLRLAVPALLGVILLSCGAIGPARFELFGLACFAAMLWLATRLDDSPAAIRLESTATPVARRIRWPLMMGAVALMTLWANLHGSFLLGVAFLACFAVGRLVDVAWRTRSVGRVVGDESAQGWLLLTEAALLATLVNPYGINLWTETLRVLQTQRVLPMADWLPLNLLTTTGVAWLLSVVVLAAVLRHSRRAVLPRDVFLILFFGAALVLTTRALPWYAMAYMFVLCPHLGDVAGRMFAAPPASQEGEADAQCPARSFKATLLAALAIWCTFALSPLGQGLLGGKRQWMAPGLFASFPQAAAQYLKQHVAGQVVFAPVGWSDGLVWACSPGLRAMMTSDGHRLPRRVRNDYDKILQGQSGWEPLLARYGVKTLVIDKQRQRVLATIVGQSPRWTVAFEDGTALVARAVDGQGHAVAGGKTPRAEASKNAVPET
jgi:hypothetical protein